MITILILWLFGAAQAGNSAFTGRVTDATASAIPGVEIVVINQDTGARVETLTNDAGAYRTPPLVPGTYVIQADLSGFNRLTRGPLTLPVSQTLAIDLQMQVGQ